MILQTWALIRVLQKIVHIHVYPPGPEQVTAIGYLDGKGNQKWEVLDRRSRWHDYAVKGLKAVNYVVSKIPR